MSPGGSTAAGAYLSQVFTDWLDLTHARSNHSATYGPRSIAPVTPHEQRASSSRQPQGIAHSLGKETSPASQIPLISLA